MRHVGIVRHRGICSLAAVAWALTAREAGAQADAFNAWRAVTIETVRQVNRAQADGLAERLQRTLVRPGVGDAERDSALLALATIERLRYRYDAADSLYDRLLASPLAPARLQGQLGRALADAIRSRTRSADSLFNATVASASGLGDTRTRAEALLAASAVRARLRGARAQRAALDSADAALALDPGDSALVANARCLALRSMPAADSEAVKRALAAHVALADRHDAPRVAASCFAMAGSGQVAAGYAVYGLAWLDSAITRAHAVGDLATAATAGQWRGYAWIAIGAYFSARDVLAQAMRDADAAGAANVLAWATLNSAQVLDGLAYGERARAAFDRAGRLMEGTDDAAGSGMVRGFLLAQALRERRLEDARTMLDAQFAAARASGNQAMLANTSSLDAYARAMAGDADGALRSDSAARSLEARLGRNAGLEDRNRHGTVLLAVGRPAEAVPVLREAAGLTLPRQPRYRYEARLRLALALAESGDVEAAAREARAAGAEFNTWRSGVNQAALRASAFQSTALLLGVGESLPRLVAALARAGRLDEAMTIAEEARGRSLVDAWSAGESRRLDASEHGVPIGALGDVQVDQATALVHFTVGRDATTPTTVLLRTAAGVTLHMAPPLAQLLSPIGRWMALLQGDQRDSAAAVQVGEALLGPLVRALPPGTRRLIIVPDGALHLVPFAALRVAGRRLGDRFSLSQAPSASMLALMRARPVARRPPRALLVADAERPAPTSEATVDAASPVPFGPLPGARAEVRAVARLIKGASVRVGAEATPSLLDEPGWSAYPIVHFAVHTLIDDREVDGSLLVLASRDASRGFVTASDLRRSALAPDVVVLSACRSAAGLTLTGEGVRGLPSALLGIGVRVVLATRWDLPDGEASAIVIPFYRALLRGDRADEALQAAEREATARHVSPRTRDAFMLVGDGAYRLAGATATR